MEVVIKPVGGVAALFCTARILVDMEYDWPEVKRHKLMTAQPTSM
jgi:hypothetical protein